jgi:hypothetical protein
VQLPALGRLHNVNSSTLATDADKMADYYDQRSTLQYHHQLPLPLLPRLLLHALAMHATSISLPHSSYSSSKSPHTNIHTHTPTVDKHNPRTLLTISSQIRSLQRRAAAGRHVNSPLPAHTDRQTDDSRPSLNRAIIVLRSR